VRAEGVEEYMKGFAGHKGVTLEEAVKGESASHQPAVSTT